MAIPSKSAVSVSKEVAAGARVYSNFLLSIYDLYYLRFELSFIFKCPLQKIVDFCNENISDTHLDVGVGTGYFLDKCNFPVKNPTIHIMDLNLNSLRKTSNRIKRYNPVSHHCNVLAPIKESLPTFNSIGTLSLLHCLPGTMLSKDLAIKHLKPFLCRGGVFFGTTILGQNVDAGPLYRIANFIYNKTSVVCNLNDNRDDLEKILGNNFKQYSVQVVGSVALFTGHD